MTRIFFFFLSVVPQGFRKKHIHEDCNFPSHKTHFNQANIFDDSDNTCSIEKNTPGTTLSQQLSISNCKTDAVRTGG